MTAVSSETINNRCHNHDIIGISKYLYVWIRRDENTDCVGSEREREHERGIYNIHIIYLCIIIVYHDTDRRFTTSDGLVVEGAGTDVVLHGDITYLLIEIVSVAIIIGRTVAK